MSLGFYYNRFKVLCFRKKKEEAKKVLVKKIFPKLETLSNTKIIPVQKKLEDLLNNNLIYLENSNFDEIVTNGPIVLDYFFEQLFKTQNFRNTLDLSNLYISYLIGFRNNYLDDEKLFYKNLDGDFNEIKIYRDKKSFIFENPYSSNDYVQGEMDVESWSRLKHLLFYNKHKSTSKNSNASKFLNGVNIKELEKLTYFKGIGILKNSNSNSNCFNQIFFYSQFSQDIGVLNNGRRTRFMVVQADRTKRNDGKGYNTLIHGYPISYQEYYGNLPSYLVRKLRKSQKDIIRL